MPELSEFKYCPEGKVFMVTSIITQIIVTVSIYFYFISRLAAHGAQNQITVPFQVHALSPI